MEKPIARNEDPTHDILRYQRQPLDAIFAPRTVAVIGATEKTGSVGRTILWNLISNPFGGVVFPVNPKRSSILGIKAYSSIAEVPEQVDLAVVVTPAPTVPAVIAECADNGVKGAIVISAGFKEAGEAGAKLEEQVLEQARRGKMRIIGPNCLGVMNPPAGFNATFASSMARPGNVGFISQSGALCTAVLDWSFREHVGFSAFVSIGSMLDVGWGDLIYKLGDDPHTKSIVIYMESVGDARSFLSAAHEVAYSKPIILIKAGRTAAAAKAAASHTGALTGSDEVLDAALRRSGVVRVNNIAEVFYMAEVLAKQPRPNGPRLTILTNAGGPGVLATDALITEGGKLAELSPETFEKLDKLLPAHWSHGNPIDVLGDADPERYAKATEIAAQDPNSDGLLVILTPQAMTDPTQTAEQIKSRVKTQGKPILASWMGGPEIEPGDEIFNRANIPTFAYPDTAARVFNYMWQYSHRLNGLYETPQLPIISDDDAPQREKVGEIIKAAGESGRTLLTEFESKQILAAYGIPTVETQLAHSEKEAVKIAAQIGYPVVLKLHSETITHKTDVGGVQLNLADEAAVREAYHTIESSVLDKAGKEHFAGVTIQPMVRTSGYELIVGSSIDAQFGPVMLFGSGGQLVEVFKDRALALPPLTTTLARRMMERTHILAALKGVRGRKPVDLAELEKLLVRFSYLVVEQRWISEIDINPLLASSDGLIALDARIVLHDLAVGEENLPRPAIRPYPAEYAGVWEAKDGARFNIRPIRAEDEPLMVKFHEALSEHSVYMRYLSPMKLSQRIAHKRLARLCFIDYDNEMALIALHGDKKNDAQKIAGVARLVKLRASNEAEFAIILSDAFQGKGLGTELLSRLVHIGRAENVRRIVGDILPDNRGMQRVCEKLGFRLRFDADDGLMKAEIEL